MQIEKRAWSIREFLTDVHRCFFRDNSKRQWEGVMKQPHTKCLMFRDMRTALFSYSSLYKACIIIISLTQQAKSTSALSSSWTARSSSVAVALSWTSRRGGAVICRWHLGCAGLPCGNNMKHSVLLWWQILQRHQSKTLDFWTGRQIWKTRL